MLFTKNYPVSCHTSHVGSGTTFVAIDGFSQSGSSFVKQAIENGATKIVLGRSSEKNLDMSEYKSVEFCFVDNCRKSLAMLSAERLGHPASKLKIIGITGTKGKTSTTFLVEHILSYSGYKTALVGSIKNKIGSREIFSERTTPESDYLHMFFHECVAQNIDYVVMEVSSHAIELERIYGIDFDIVGFTNLAAEHLDFHKTLEDYYETKSRLFSQVKKDGSIIINCDDDWGKKSYEALVEKNLDLSLVQFGQNNFSKNNFDKSNFSIKKNSIDGLELDVDTGAFLKTKRLFGEFNAYNIVMAYQICKQIGVKDEIIQYALRIFGGIPGRLQHYRLKNNARAFVDYAHNPSSFDAVLKSLRAITKNLIVVFGCGGDRDKTKRPVMANLASTYGDFVIITDDNPRGESRDKIIDEVYAGIPFDKKAKTLCIIDRAKAIKKAVDLSSSDSIIALLGKGHESYYLYKGEKKYFSDCEEIAKYL